MVSRSTNRKIEPTAALTNRQIALELTKAALQGGVLSTVKTSSDDPVEATRRHATYTTRLFHYVEKRLDARDAASTADDQSTDVKKTVA